MRLVYTTITWPGHPTHIGHQIAIAFMSPCGGKVIARVGAQQRHQGIDQRGLAAPGGADHSGAGCIDISAVITPETAPIVEFQAGQDERFTVTPKGCLLHARSSSFSDSELGVTPVSRWARSHVTNACKFSGLARWVMIGRMTTRSCASGADTKPCPLSWSSSVMTRLRSLASLPSSPR